jgi:thiol:disulfide interchange protein DsbD
MPPDVDVSAFSVWLLGASLGLTACAATCMPFIGTWVFARADAQAGAWRDTLSFLGGRLTAYALLGGLAGGLGAWFVRELASGIGNLAIGLSAIVSAAWLAWPATAHSLCQRMKKTNGVSPFLMGATLTLIPCAPLATVLAASAAGGSIGRGAFLGTVFGLGALFTPMLVLIPACAMFGRRLRQHQGWIMPWMTAGAALVLLALAQARIDLVAEDLFPYLIGIASLVVVWSHLRHRRRQALPVIALRLR